MQIICGKRNSPGCKLGMSLCTQRKKAANNLFLFFKSRLSCRRVKDATQGKHVTFLQQQHQQRWLTTFLIAVSQHRLLLKLWIQCVLYIVRHKYRRIPIQLHHSLPCSFIQTFCIFHVSRLAHIWRKRLSNCYFHINVPQTSVKDRLSSSRTPKLKLTLPLWALITDLYSLAAQVRTTAKDKADVASITLETRRFPGAGKKQGGKETPQGVARCIFVNRVEKEEKISVTSPWGGKQKVDATVSKEWVTHRR